MKYFQNLLLLGINISTILLGQSIEIPHKMMEQGTTLNIPIFIYDISNLQSIHLKMKYDETIINALEIIEKLIPNNNRFWKYFMYKNYYLSKTNFFTDTNSSASIL